MAQAYFPVDHACGTQLVTTLTRPWQALSQLTMLVASGSTLGCTWRFQLTVLVASGSTLTRTWQALFQLAMLVASISTLPGHGSFS